MHADAIEQRAAGMTVGNHCKSSLDLANLVPQVEIEMAGEIRNLVAEFGEPALQRDALVA